MTVKERFCLPFIFVLAVFFTSCSNDNTPGLLGTWACNEGYLQDCEEGSVNSNLECVGFEVTFLADGTYTTHFESDGAVLENEGTFFLSDDFLILNLESGDESADKINLSDKELEIINEQGEGCQLIWVYTRV